MKSRVTAKHPNAWLFTAMFAISVCCCSTSRTNLTFDFAMQQPKCHYVWALTGRPSRYYCYPLSFVFPSISIFNFSLIAHESSSILAAPLYDVYPVTDSHWCVSQSVWLAVFSHVREYMRWFVCVYRAVQCTLCCACAALLPNAIRRVDGSLCCHQPPPQTHTGTHALMVLHCLLEHPPWYARKPYGCECVCFGISIHARKIDKVTLRMDNGCWMRRVHGALGSISQESM